MGKSKKQTAMGSTKVTKKSTKRERTKYTSEQLEILEKVFEKTQYPDSFIMEDLADKLEISNDKVSVWFQNRRSKFKRQSKDSQVAWMRNQVFNQENRPPFLAIPRIAESKRHVLSVSTMDRICTPDNKKPSSNLHYKPTTDNTSATSSGLSWEPGFRYTTPSPPFDMSSCASDILRDSNINPVIARPDYPTDIQYYGQPSPSNFWQNCMVTPPNTILPVQPANTIGQFYPFFPPINFSSQQFNAL